MGEVRVDELKVGLRSRMKQLRNALSAEERAATDKAICEKLCATEEFRRADVVLSYLSFGAEVDTRGIIERAWDSGKVVALPRCTGPRQMRWFRVSNFNGLEKSSFGVEEPPLNELVEQHINEAARVLAVIPGLAFDAHGYRLGYGGGFYDAFLSEFSGRSVGLCRAVQQVESLDTLGVIGEFDLPVDIVVTER